MDFQADLRQAATSIFKSAILQPFATSHLLYCNQDILAQTSSIKNELEVKATGVFGAASYINEKFGLTGLWRGLAYYPVLFVSKQYIYRGLGKLIPITDASSKAAKSAFIGVASLVLTYPILYLYVRSTGSHLRDLNAQDELKHLVEEGKLASLFTGCGIYILSQLVQRPLIYWLTSKIDVISFVKDVDISRAINIGLVTALSTVAVYPLFRIRNAQILSEHEVEKRTLGDFFKQDIGFYFRGAVSLGLVTFCASAVTKGVEIYVKKR